MRSGGFLGATLIAAVVFAACGGGDDVGPAPPGDASVPPSDAGDAAPDVVSDAGPVRAPFGLDARPANPTCLAPARPPAPGAVKFERVYANVDLGYPMGMAMAPGDPSRWYSVSLNGYILSFPAKNPPNAPDVVADLKNDPNFPSIQSGESGLFGLAFHPKFAQNGRIYVSYGTNGGPPPGGIRSMIARLTSTDGGKTFGPPTPIVGPFDQPSGHHMGGGILFGKDGFLYASFGDGGDPFVAQRTTSFFAKVIRIDVDSPPAPGLAYAIPPDNPFASGAGGERATFAYGLRNPFRMSMDRDTGEIWVGDVGDGAWEEIDVISLGGNYGYPCREGAHDGTLADDIAACPSKVGLVEPVAEYDHGNPASGSITGGVVYRGKAMPSFRGTYVYGDYVRGDVWGLTFDPTTGAPKQVLLNPTGPSGGWAAFSEDLDGEIYAVDMYNGFVYKLVPNGPEPASAFPDRLSKTGCVDPKSPGIPAPGVIPFAPSSPLWSDGADKERFLAIPDGKTIHVGADGDFDLPIGSVAMKTFTLGGKKIETRLLVRHDDGEWAGYSYEWLDDQSDAILLGGGKTKSLGAGRSWSFPSRSGCVSCHTKAAGRTLGLEVGQLDRDLVYGNRISNELATLEHIGLFDAPLGGAIASLPRYPDPRGAAPLEARARSYLHANCSQCHRPGGPGPATFDVRYATPFASTKTCNALPQSGALGVPTAKILAPGSPATSLLSLRPHAKNVARMPPLGSLVVDDAGLKVLDDWIASVAACP